MTDDDRAQLFDFDNSGPFGNSKRRDRLRAAFAEIREECAKIADRNTYMNPDADDGGNFGGPGHCEYDCGKVIARVIRAGGSHV